MDLVRYFGRATGHVQGVGFRFFVQGLATDLGIVGWVKNMSDGSVTMEIQGSKEKIAELITEIKKGNGFCKVKNLELEKRASIEENDTGFQIRW